MRSIIAGAALVVLLLTLGCNTSPIRPPVNPGLDDSARPTVANLVDYLNKNAQRIESTEAIDCSNVLIDVKAQGNNVGISSLMRCQKPRNFRLAGKVLGNPAVDIGSNDREFWYWISRNKPPYVFHCSYEAMAHGAQVPFPFQPDMVVEALGLATYDPAKDYKLNVKDAGRGSRVYELTEKTISAQNQRIQKVTVFNASRTSLPQPQVIAHLLLDERGNVICRANVRSAQLVGSKGLIIPKEVTFDWPEQKLTMKMRLENPQVITMTEEKATAVFTRRNLNYQSFDLATGRLDNEALQQAGATGPVYRR